MTFLFDLLKSISLHGENVLLINKKNQELISVCDYFLKVVQLVHYYYEFPRLYYTIDQDLLPKLASEQPSEQIEVLRKQLERLRSTPMKLSELSRKIIRQNITLPTKTEIKKLGLTGHLVNFLTQSAL
jgi:hypothetical protein